MIGLEYIIKIEKETTAALAKLLNVTAPTITQWLKKNRNIPTDRLEQLHEIFPIYPIEYFQKTIDEQDALKLQNFRISHYIAALQDKDDIESIRTKNALKEKREYNNNLAMQQRIISQTKMIFEKSYELSKGNSNYNLIRRNMIDNFARFCDLEERIVTLSATMSKPDSEVIQALKSLIECLKEQISELEYFEELNK